MAKGNLAAVAANTPAVESNIGRGVKTRVEGNTLTITIDLGANHGPSKSGKTVIIASTDGNAPVPGANGAVLGLNIYRK